MHGEISCTQSVNGQCDRLWTRLTGAPLMIIERIQQSLIMRVQRTDAQGPRDAETEESRHLILDQRLAYSIELTHRQNIQQGGAGDQAMITITAS